MTHYPIITRTTYNTVVLRCSCEQLAVTSVGITSETDLARKFGDHVEESTTPQFPRHFSENELRMISYALVFVKNRAQENERLMSGLQGQPYRPGETMWNSLGTALKLVDQGVSDYLQECLSDHDINSKKDHE